ncbi:MAG: extracellular solute-binding protein [Bacteroidia bacterium]|nr:extracellular solute-binding protein [Bacteroidia bacterium]
MIQNKFSTLEYRAVIIILSVFCSAFTIRNDLPLKKDDLEGTISISGAFALYPIAIKWGEEFKKLHPKVRFDISAGGAGKGISDALGGMVDLGAVSRDLYPEETKRGAVPFAVTRDAVIPTVNWANPNIKEIAVKGLKKEDFANIYASGQYKNWKQAGFSVSAPIRAYTRSDAAGAAESWAKYFGKKQEDLLGIGVYGDPGLLSAVKKDILGIGFNNITYVFDAKTGKQLKGIAIVPIDVNSNGKIDTDENFYGNITEFIKAVAEGKYPSPPARDLYFVSKNKPQKKVVVEFLKWVLSEGQKFVGEAGYVKLSEAKLKAELTKISL